jgi:hypothetical protein
MQITFSKHTGLRTWSFKDTGWVRKFATLSIKNNGKATAKRCVAVMTILKTPRDANDVEDKYTLHWAGVDYTTQTTGAEPVDIGPEPRRLDVAFTQQGQQIKGCWIAMPLALSGFLERNQAYLLPGDYEVEIRIRCENGKGDKQKFRITSPDMWKDLDVDIL